MTRERCRRYFLEQLAKYGEVDFYWLEDRVVTRCVHVTLRVPVSPSAVFVGRYAYPFSPEAFLADLDDALRLQAAHA